MTTAELTQDPGLAPLLPFVKLWYSAPCVYTWTDDSGMVHQVHQSEGVEQGYTLSPLLFSLAVHGALRTASAKLQPGEHLFAFLDDMYTVTSKSRAVPVARLVAKAIHEHARVEPKLCKFQAWAKGEGTEPPGLEDFLTGARRPDEVRPRVPTKRVGGSSRGLGRTAQPASKQPASARS